MNTVLVTNMLLFQQQQQLLIQSTKNKKACSEESIPNPWEAVLLAQILASLLTIVGIILEIQDQPMTTCALVGSLVIASFPIWGVCVKYMMSSYKLKDKVRLSVAAAVVALLTYIPAAYFMFAGSTVTKWGHTSHITYMVVLSIVVVILGLSAVMLPLCHLLYIRHKCRVWVWSRRDI